jgi:hypothetical protein
LALAALLALALCLVAMAAHHPFLASHLPVVVVVARLAALPVVDLAALAAAAHLAVALLDWQHRSVKVTTAALAVQMVRSGPALAAVVHPLLVDHQALALRPVTAVMV